MKQKKLLKGLFLLALLVGVCLVNDGKVFAQKKDVRIYKISGNKITYREILGWEEYDGVEEDVLGRKSTIRFASNVKCYWYKSNNISKYKKITKKEFVKRVKYRYNPFDNNGRGRYERDWRNGKLIKNGNQYAAFQISKGKVTKVWGKYEP